MSTPRKVGLLAVLFVGSWLVGLLIVRLYTGGGTVYPTYTDAEVRALSSDPGELEAYLEAVEAIGQQYEFTSTIFQDGDPVVEVEGLVDGDLSERLVRNAAGELQVIARPGAQWERVPGLDWEAVDEQAVVLPRQALLDAHVVRLSEEDDVTWEVFFLAGALGEDTSATRAEVVLEPDGTIQFFYGSGQGSFRVEVVTFVAANPGVDIVLPA